MRYAMIISMLLFSGCSVITPPPMVAKHTTAVPSPVGSTEATLVGFHGGGLFIDDMAGGEMRGAWQATPRLALGGGFGAAYRVRKAGDDESPPRLGVAGRVFGRYNPADLDWLRLTLGVGGGAADTGLYYSTMDLGVVLSHTFFGWLTPYGGPIVAASIPIAKGDVVAEGLRPPPTGYAGGTAGLAFHLTPQLDLSAEITALHGEALDAHEEGTVMALSGGLKYRFACGDEE